MGLWNIWRKRVRVCLISFKVYSCVTHVGTGPDRPDTFALMQKYPKNQVKCDEIRLRCSVELDWRGTRDTKRRSNSAPAKMTTTCATQPSHMTGGQLKERTQLLTLIALDNNLAVTSTNGITRSYAMREGPITPSVPITWLFALYGAVIKLTPSNGNTSDSPPINT